MKKYFWKLWDIFVILNHCADIAKYGESEHEIYNDGQVDTIFLPSFLLLYVLRNTKFSSDANLEERQGFHVIHVL